MANLVGLRRLPASWQAYIQVRGRLYTTTFPPDTPLTVMRAWRERTKAEAKFGVKAIDGRTFTEDADTYLTLRVGMPSYADHAYRVRQWVAAFGHRERRTITSAEIRAVLERWRLGGLSAGSLNLRRSVLMAMGTALDGKAAPNVVKDVPVYDERGSIQHRAQSLLTMLQVIRHTRPGSRSRARLLVLLWTGWPSALLKSVRPEDVQWATGQVRLTHRKKGKGMAAAWVPVLPRAMRALRLLARRQAWGAFSGSSLHSTFARAQAAENATRQTPLPPMRVYDLRHSFGTWAAGIIKDDRALAELLRTHSIRRYTDGAAPDRLTAALQILQTHRRFGLSRPTLPPAKAEAKVRGNAQKT